MASLFAETFDTGPASGTGITTGNVGFTSVQVAGTETVTFDQVAAVFGNFGAKIVTGPGTAFFTEVFGSAQTNAYFSWYMAIAAIPSVGQVIANIKSTAATNRAQVLVNATTGTIALRSPANLISGTTSSGNYCDGLWSRFEWSCVGTVQTLKIYRGNQLHGATPTETLGGGAGSITVSGFDRFSVGPNTSDSNTVWIDAVQIDGAAMPTVLSEHNNRLVGIS